MGAGRTQITTRLDYLGTVWLVLHCLWLHPRLADRLSHIFPVPVLLGWYMVTHIYEGFLIHTN